MNWLMLLLPFAAGVLMAVQGTINGTIGKAIGSWGRKFFGAYNRHRCFVCVAFCGGDRQRQF